MHMPGPELPRFATATAVVTLLLIALGAVEGGADTALLNSRYHVYLAVIAGAMTAVLLMWLSPANLKSWLRATGWVALGLFLIDSAIMSMTTKPPVDAVLAIPHAIVAPLFLAALVVIAVYTAIDGFTAAEPIDTMAAPLVPIAAQWAPLLVICQIAMGALYRHKVWGVMPHMAGAMVVTLVLLMLAVVLLQNFPAHPTLRPMAIAAMSVLLLQVTLGIGAFVMRLLDFDTSDGFVYLAAGHVCVGALTLAASVVLSIEVRRCRPLLN